MITNESNSNLFSNSLFPLVRGQVRAACDPARSGAGHDGGGAFRPVRQAVPSGQLCVRPVRRRQQLGQGTLHRGGGAGGRRPGRGAQGVRELRLPAGGFAFFWDYVCGFTDCGSFLLGLPTDPLAGRWYWIRYGNAADLQDP
uniref:(northern house mosquito) hypothetical protein n=1 Tax=Culex pipiens TaxID=7175 RepID=A0A8D8DAP1_CULPI